WIEIRACYCIFRKRAYHFLRWENCRARRFLQRGLLRAAKRKGKALIGSSNDSCSHANYSQRVKGRGRAGKEGQFLSHAARICARRGAHKALYFPNISRACTRRRASAAHLWVKIQHELGSGGRNDVETNVVGRSQFAAAFKSQSHWK